MVHGRKWMMTTALVAALTVMTGCTSTDGLFATLLGPLLGPTTTSIELVNDGDYPVSARLYYDKHQETLDGVIQQTGTERDFTIAPGATTTFSRPCDELQAVIVDRADLRILGDIGPNTDTGLLRDGLNFGCGDTIVFTFDHSDLILDFNVTVDIVHS